MLEPDLKCDSLWFIIKPNRSYFRPKQISLDYESGGTREQRKLTTKQDKSDWFRKIGVTTTITVPTTKNSDVANRLKETLASIPGPKGTSMKYLRGRVNP